MTLNLSHLLLLITVTLPTDVANAFATLPQNHKPLTTTALNSCSSRRELFTKSAFLVTTVATSSVGFVSPAYAASTQPPTAEELKRIKKGYEGIKYLLENFEKETTVCRENGGECKRDADPVRRYMGLRSTTDPLFQIEKVFTKVKYMDVDPDQLETFFEATEDWNTAVNMSNSMAFISQFGEYNPGGGKDEVLKYLNESQKQVIIAEGALKKIIDVLGI
eukprot:CAMPEP_0172487404 /NCGR_PEP_ID=MMETSP1066-20121228/16492_1 /TAXON_ID=671091 /ORGANISM="Coscinodiscus wailesii, Strain CCMP2513" /LENGTH=219 /DNA_ID=CAMNT_0013254005 /DNA_START=88 /DNA_END=747 /DNA_ORIENTATION=+